MRKFHVVPIIILITILMMTISSCNSSGSYTVYEKPTYDDEFGAVLDINGVLYRTLPETYWDPIFNTSKRILIGQIDYSKVSYGIYTFESDIYRIFIYTGYSSLNKFTDDSRIGELYYRKDIDLPEFSANNIDSIAYHKRGNASEQYPYNNVVYDTNVINDVFNIINTTTEQSNEGRTGEVILGNFYFLNSKYEGIHIGLWASIYQNKYWLNFSKPNKRFYFEIQRELLEKLVGEELPTAKEFLEQ